MLRERESDPRGFWWHGVLYTFGVLTAFWFLSLALIGLKVGGQHLGWGFQLQSPLFVSCLAASRHGLMHTELVGILSPGDPYGNIAALERFLRPFLMRRGELLDFYHTQMRQAVEAEFLDEEHEQIETHQILAEYFRFQADPSGDGSWGGSARGLSELPHHQGQARLWDAIQNTLTDLKFIEAKCLNGMTYDLLLDYAEILESLPEAQKGLVTVMRLATGRLICR